MRIRRWFASVWLLAVCTAGRADVFDRTFFVSEIFQKYGDEEFMTYEGFEHLLENLGLGRLKFDVSHDVSIHRVNGTFREFHDELKLHRHDHGLEETVRERRDTASGDYRENSATRRRCLTPQDLLAAYGLETSHGVVISQKGFLDMCPAIVYELDEKCCGQSASQPSRTPQGDQRLVWIYATLSIFLMSVSGFVCIAAVPAVAAASYKAALEFMVAVGVGTLCGDAFLHLLPHVLSHVSDDGGKTQAAMRGAFVFLSVCLFFLLETLVKSFHSQKSEGESSDKMISGRERNGCRGAHGGSDAVASMVIIGDILHNVTDGLSIGAAFTSGIPTGLASSIAIFAHELPHEIGDYAALLNSGMKRKRALMYNMVSSIFSFFGMVTGVLLGEVRHASLWINAFTAGSFLYIALSDLVPEMKTYLDEDCKRKRIAVQFTGLLCGGLIMLCVALFEEDLEDLIGQ